MMSLRFRYLELRVLTDQGPYGVTLEFSDGLCVLRADNGLGKSTCIQALFYGLGLEGMFGPWHEAPLPHAVKEYLDTPDGGKGRVLESSVMLEVENSAGQRLAIRRPISKQDGRVDNRIVETWMGAAFSQDQRELEKRDYFVRFEGAAQRERGFHNFLENFIGWELPRVPRYQQEDGKLYLEAVFPLMYVEQKKGWGVIGADFPSYLRIQDVSARATEFLLSLDAYDLAQRRNELAELEKRLITAWKTQVAEGRKLAQVIHGIVEGLPEVPASDWPPPVEPRIMVPKEDKWRSLGQAIAGVTEELTHLQHAEVPEVGDSIEEAKSRLEEAQSELAELETRVEALVEDVHAEHQELESTERQLAVLQDDLDRNRDLLRLREIGSTEPWKLEAEVCPTCLQDVPDTLLPLAPGERVLTVEHQIEFIRQQQEVFRALREESGRTLTLRRRRLAAANQQLDELRDEVRGLRRTLASHPSGPSYEVIRRQVELVERAGEMKRIQLLFGEVLNELAYLSGQWEELQKERAALPKRDLSQDDLSKLELLEELLIRDLEIMELRSVDADSVHISLDSYRPIHHGFDLQFDFSASDTIRTIWAYRLALLQLARKVTTNHLGFVVFDEPRQHNTDATSIQKFFDLAAEAREAQQQVIVATSGDEELVRRLLENLPHSYRTFHEKMLSPI